MSRPSSAGAAAVRGRPSPAELVALLVALEDGTDPDGTESTPVQRPPIGRWNDPAAGMRGASWAHDLSPQRYGRFDPGGSR